MAYKATSNPTTPSADTHAATVSRLRQVLTRSRCERITRSRSATRITMAQASPWRTTWTTRTAPVLTSSRAVASVIGCNMPASDVSLCPVLLVRFLNAVIEAGQSEGFDLTYHPFRELAVTALFGSLTVGQGQREGGQKTTQ